MSKKRSKASQSDTPAPMAKDGRKPDGTFAEGNSGNPEGHNGHTKGYQIYSQRVIYLAEKYTPDQIFEYATDDKKRGKDMSFWDGMCIVHMARTMFKELTRTESGADHVGKERTALLDRLEGTPKQTIEHQGNPDRPLYPESTKTVTDAATAYRDAVSGS